MPIYEYECEKCGHVTSVLQKMNDKAPSECSKCGAHDSMHKKVSCSSFILKGGGWFKDCYPDSKSPGTCPCHTPQDDASAKASDSEPSTQSPCATCKGASDCEHSNVKS